MASTAAIQPAWTLQSQDTAAVGRYHDGAFLQSLSTTPNNIYRSGVIPTVMTGGNAVPIDLFVTQAGTPNMTVLVNPGNAVVANSSGRGPYVCENTGTQTLTVATSDPTNPRIDLVYLQVIDTVAGDTGSSTTQVGIVTGTPASSPSVPALPTNGVSIPLVQVRVNATVTSITNSNITDVRKGAAVGRGPRFLLPGDSLSDPGFCCGELRQRRLSSYPANGSDTIVTDKWGFDSAWHGTDDLSLSSGNITQNGSNFGFNTEVKFWTLTIPDPGWPYYVELTASAFRQWPGSGFYAQLFVTIGTTITGTHVREFTADSSVAGATVAITGDVWNSTLGTPFTGTTSLIVTNDTGTSGTLAAQNMWCSAIIKPV